VYIPNIATTQTGVIAQLVERYNGIVEVRSSILLDSTKVVLPVLPQLSLSSRGLGHRPFTAVTGVRIPVGTPYSRWRIRYLIKKLKHCDLGFFIACYFSFPVKIRYRLKLWSCNAIPLPTMPKPENYACC
jgi:hypothetical protein